MKSSKTRFDVTTLPAAVALAALALVAAAWSIPAGAQQLLQPQGEANARIPGHARTTGNGREWEEGPYNIHVRFQGGRVREVTIRPASSSTPGPKPDWALISRFAPAGVDPNRPSRHVDEQDPQSYLLFTKREWDVPGGQIKLTMNVYGRHSSYKQQGDLGQASWWIEGSPVPAAVVAAPPPPAAVVSVPGTYQTPDGQVVQLVGFSDQRWRGFYPGRELRSGNESIRIDFAPAGPNAHNGEVNTDVGWQAARFTRTPTGITVVYQDGRTSVLVRSGR
jgi:hypothetical protein